WTIVFHLPFSRLTLVPPIFTLFPYTTLSRSANGVKTVAYSYIGPELTYPIYRNGTIGRAKDDLEGTVPVLNDLLQDIGGISYVSDRKSTRLNSSHVKISYAVFCLKKKKRLVK